MAKVSKAPDDVQDLLQSLKRQHHSPRLDDASIAVCFEGGKPFKKNRFNWGKAKKFPPLARPFEGDHYTFVVVLPEAGYELLTHDQRKAWLDLHLETCQVEYVPETVVDNKKKRVVTDEFGRTVFTDEVKRNDDGEPTWTVVPLDLPVYSANAKRYGCWCEDLAVMREVVNEAQMPAAAD